MLFRIHEACAGCKALQGSKKKYKCRLGYAVVFKVADGTPYAPQPKEKCWHPDTDKEMKEAKENAKSDSTSNKD